jgi:hypothetical protein
MLPTSPSEAAQTAFRTVAAAGEGFDIAYVLVEIKGVSFAASSRITTRGTVVIELDCAQPGLTPRFITGSTYRNAVKRAASRGQSTNRRI